MTLAAMRPLALHLAGTAVALFLVLPSASGGEVLCIGSDGHVRLEEAARADCHDREGRPLGALGAKLTERAPFAAGERDPECGPCADFSVESLLSALSKGSGPVAPAPPSGLVLASASSSGASAFLSAPARPTGARAERSSRDLSRLGVFRC